MVSRRALLTTAGVAAVTFGFTANFGFYSPPAMALVLVGGAAVLWAVFERERPVRLPASWQTAIYLGPVAIFVAIAVNQGLKARTPQVALITGVLAVLAALVAIPAYLGRLRPANSLHAALIGGGVLLSGQAILTSQVLYPELSRAWATVVIMAAAVLGYLVWLSFLAAPRRTPRRAWTWTVRFVLLLIAGLGVRALAVVASPRPIIDVNSWLQTAPRYLLAGENPYAADYPSPYGTERALQHGITQPPEARPATYPPTVILTGLPAAWLGFDARYLNVLADLIAALLILLVGKQAGQVETGLLASGIYLCLPRAPFMIEQGWFEPQLAALLGVFLVWAVRRPWLAGVALGAFTAGKQYSVVLLPSLIKAWWRKPVVLVIAAATAIIIILPFFLWSPADFWQIVIAKHLARPVMPHALTLLALAKHVTGADIPPLALWVLAAVVIALIAWRTPPVAKAGPALALGAALLVFILCHKQGFFNYYYLAVYLLLVAIVQLASRQALHPAGQTTPR